MRYEDGKELNYCFLLPAELGELILNEIILPASQFSAMRLSQIESDLAI